MKSFFLMACGLNRLQNCSVSSSDSEMCFAIFCLRSVVIYGGTAAPIERGAGQNYQILILIAFPLSCIPSLQCRKNNIGDVIIRQSTVRSVIAAGQQDDSVKFRYD